MEFKMLVVDDEKDVTTALERRFRADGYKVVVANSGEKAREVIDKEPIDLILLDIEMPGISGLDILEYVKSKNREIKVIIVTGYSEYKQKAEKLGCDGFITKPFSLRRLTGIIIDLLKEKDRAELKGVTFWDVRKRMRSGDPVADILLIEPIEDMGVAIGVFLQDFSRSNGFYKVHLVENKEQALGLQEIFYVDIVMVDLRTFISPVEVLEELKKAKHPPKDFIFYFEPDMLDNKDREKLKEMKAKYWENANPFDEKGLAKLAEIVRATALEHGLAKK